MAGYYGGGVASGFGEGLGEGSAIVANTATLGQVNSLSSYTSTLQGGAYDASRVFSGIGVGAFALASGAAALEVPGIYAGATTAAYSPWAPVVAGGVGAGAYTYSQGGNASDVALSTVTGSAMMYMAAPFPMGGQNAPPTTATQPGSLYSRGTFRVGTVEQALGEAPINTAGQIVCPTCEEVIPPTIQVQTVNGLVTRRGFDLDHFPTTWSQRVQAMQQQSAPPTRQQVLDAYNQAVRVQCPECNQGHQFEGQPGPGN
jgi:hypothetical protein